MYGISHAKAIFAAKQTLPDNPNDRRMEGRTIYDNIVKFVRFQLSTNIGAILTVLGAPLFGLPTPFTAIQIRWVNVAGSGHRGGAANRRGPLGTGPGRLRYRKPDSPGLGLIGGDCVQHPAGRRSARDRRPVGVRREGGSCGIALMLIEWTMAEAGRP